MLNHSLSTPILSLQEGGQFAAILRGQFVRLFQILYIRTKIIFWDNIDNPDECNNTFAHLPNCASPRTL